MADWDLESDSTKQLICCSEFGCGAAMLSFSELAKHLKNDCVIAHRRRVLAQKSRARELEKARQLIEELERRRRLPNEDEHPENDSVDDRDDEMSPSFLDEPSGEVFDNICSKCGLFIVTSKWRHDCDHCTARSISCPNKCFGCPAMIPLSETSTHLREDCIHELKRNVLVEKARQREEFAPCPGCSKEVQIRMIHKHDRDECSNRKVSCRNAYLGCAAKIRVREKPMHEEIDSFMTASRSTLYLHGGGTNLGVSKNFDTCNGGGHIFLGENDIVAPWTVEYWVFRPSKGEVAKAHIKNIICLRPLVWERVMFECGLYMRIKGLQTKIHELQAQVNAPTKKNPTKAQTAADEILNSALVLSKLLNLYDESIVLTSGWTRLLDIHFRCCFIALTDLDDESVDLHSLESTNCNTVPDAGLQRNRRVCNSCGLLLSSDNGLDTCQNCTAISLKSVETSMDPITMALDRLHGTSDKAKLDANHKAVLDAKPMQETNTTYGNLGNNFEEEKREEGRFVEGVGFVTGELLGVNQSEQSASPQPNTEAPPSTVQSTEQVQSADIFIDEVAVSSSGSSFAASMNENIDDVSENKVVNEIARISHSTINSSDGKWSSSIPIQDVNRDETKTDTFGLTLMEIDLAPLRTWGEWIEVVSDLHNEFSKHVEHLKNTRIASGLQTKVDDRENALGGKATNRKMSKADVKEQKEKEKKERIKKKKEAKRLAHAEANDVDNIESDAQVGDEEKLKSVPKVVKKLQQRIDEMEQCATAIDTIATSDLGIPAWVMQPYNFDFSDPLATASEELELPEIHSFSNVPSRICLSIPQLIGSDKVTAGGSQRRDSTRGRTSSRGRTLSTGSMGSESSFEDHDTEINSESGIDFSFGLEGNESQLRKYEERIGIVCQQGLHVFRHPNACVPYDCWTHVAITCSGPGPLERLGNPGDSRPTSKASDRPIAAEMKKNTGNDRVNLIPTGLATVSTPQLSPSGSPSATPPGSPAGKNTTRKSIRSEQSERNRTTQEALTCYVNGKHAGQIKGVSFNLPMKSIGASEFSFHGCLLDVRYWATVRSKQDIVHNMNRLLVLPDSTPLKGLVGWWTFEDGERSSTVTDVSEQRFRKEIHGHKYDIRQAENVVIAKKQIALNEARERFDKAIKSGATNAEKDAAKKAISFADLDLNKVSGIGGALKPVVSTEFAWLDAVAVVKGSSDLSLSQSALVDEKELIPVPSYTAKKFCPFEIKRYKLAQKGRALLNEVQCPNSCGLMLRRLDVRFHVRFLCTMRRVCCRRDGCQETYPWALEEQHERFECTLIEKHNEWLSKHEIMNTIVVCDACGRELKRKYLKVHEANQCIFRMVTCIYSDCCERLKASETEAHYKYDCRSKSLKHRYELVARARLNRGYPRPWGFEIEFDVSSVSPDMNNVTSLLEERDESEEESKMQKGHISRPLTSMTDTLSDDGMERSY